MNDLEQLLSAPASANHLVQFYGDETLLSNNVAHYLKEGAERGDWAIVMATPSHTADFCKKLNADGVDVESLIHSGRLILQDAQTTLSRFMKAGQPDWEEFDGVVGQLIRELKNTARVSGIRVYGEMVDLLWASGQLLAASRLEEFWNRILESYQFILYCAYTVDILAQEDQGAAMQEMLRTHSHLLPVRMNGNLESAVDRALLEVLGEKTAGAIQPLVRHAKHMGAALPRAEGIILWLRKNLPTYSNEVLSRARAYYMALCEEHRK